MVMAWPTPTTQGLLAPAFVVCVLDHHLSIPRCHFQHEAIAAFSGHPVVALRTIISCRPDVHVISSDSGLWSEQCWCILPALHCIHSEFKLASSQEDSTKCLYASAHCGHASLNYVRGVRCIPKVELIWRLCSFTVAVSYYCPKQAQYYPNSSSVTTENKLAAVWHLLNYTRAHTSSDILTTATCFKQLALWKD